MGSKEIGRLALGLGLAERDGYNIKGCDSMRLPEDFGKHFLFDNGFWGAPLRCGFINLYQIGEICCEPGYQIEEHLQHVNEITYVISGSGYAYVDGERISLAEGDIMINTTNHRHSIEAGSSNLLRFTYMGFKFNNAANTDEFIKLKDIYSDKPYQIARDEHNLLYPFIRCIDEMYMQRSNSFLMIKNYCEQIVTLAARAFEGVKSVPSGRIVDPGIVSSNVYYVIRYIEEHICDINSIKELAEILGFNHTYLSHFFKEKTGITLQRYISYKKTEKALHFLKYGDLSVTQISERLGYESSQSFSKAFRRVMGYSPTQYVKLMAEQENENMTIPPDPLFRLRGKEEEKKD